MNFLLLALAMTVEIAGADGKVAVVPSLHPCGGGVDEAAARQA